jgi:hypothetical protein
MRVRSMQKSDERELERRCGVESTGLNAPCTLAPPEARDRSHIHLQADELADAPRRERLGRCARRAQQAWK